MAGMFGNLFGPDPDAQERDRRQRAIAQMTPDQQLRYTANSSAAGVGEGISQAFGGGSNRGKAAEEIKALAQTVRPGTPEFYDKAIAILQKYGMVEEATAMQEKADAIKQRGIENERAARTGSSDVEKWQRTLDALQKRLDAGDQSVVPAIEAIKQRLKTYGVGKGTGSGAQSGLGKLIADMNAETDPKIKAWYGQKIMKELKSGGGGELTPALKIQMARLEAQIERWKHEDARKDAKEQREQGKADDARQAAIDERIKALTAYDEQLGIQIRDATELRDHPGLANITGPIFGRTPSLTDAGAAAEAVFARVQGQTFLSALNDLKKTSKVGASGLGQLTEVEGAKIQNAKAALLQTQPTESMIQHIDQYLLELKSAKEAADRELTEGYKQPIPPTPVLPKGYKPKQNPKTEPQPEMQGGKPAAKKGPVKNFEVMPDGTIKRSN